MGKRHMTNEEKVHYMMRFSKYGALRQMFIMEALRQYSQLVIDAGAEHFDSGFINGEAWVGVAGETLKDLDTEMRVNDKDFDDEEVWEDEIVPDDSPSLDPDHPFNVGGPGGRSAGDY